MKMLLEGKRILLVDDDGVFLRTLGRSLSRRGAEVVEALDTASALLQVERQPFDLILLDLNLGGESGLQALQCILAKRPGACVVMLTAYASVATAVDAIKRGAENYLCKPVSASDVMALLAPETDMDAPETATVPDNPLSVDRLEWEHVQRVLMENNGNISATARALNMHRRTLQRKLQKKPVEK